MFGSAQGFQEEIHPHAAGLSKNRSEPGGGRAGPWNYDQSGVP